MGCWTSTATKLRALRVLPREDRSLFLQALLFLRLVSVALWLVGFGRVQRLLVHLSGRRRRLDVHTGPGALRSCVWAVAAAARHGFPRANCLEQSLLLWWFLRRLGAAAEIRIGVRKQDGLLQAHAWVEVNGQVLTDTQDVRARFAPFEREIATAVARPR